MRLLCLFLVGILGGLGQCPGIPGHVPKLSLEVEGHSSVQRGADTNDTFIKIYCHEFCCYLIFYNPSTLFRSFQVQSVNLATLFLGKPPRQFAST